MKSIFTKTIVAASIASVGFANAATIGTVDTSAATGVQPQKISQEGYNALTYIDVGTGSNDLTVTLTSGATANYVNTDIITVTFAGATIKNTSTAGIAMTVSGCTQGTTDSDSDGVFQDCTFSALGIDTTNNAITFRVDTNQEFEANTTAQLSGVRLTGVSGSITASATVNSFGQIIDSAAAQTVATIGSQFSGLKATATTLDRTINVEKNRKEFVALTGSTDVKNDSVEFSFDADGAHLLVAEVGTASISLTASENMDFLLGSTGALDSASYDLLPTASLSEDTTSTNKATYDSTTKTLTVKSTAATTSNADAAIGIGLTVDGNVAAGSVLADQTFSATGSLTYSYDHDGSTGGVHGSTGGTVSLGTASAGAWKLSGATRFVEFMPFGAGITQFIYVSNTSDVTGDIEVTAWDNSGQAYGPVTIGTSAAGKSVTNITAATVEALTSAGANTSTGRLALQFVINSPDANVDVTAGYNSRGDRVLID